MMFSAKLFTIVAAVLAVAVNGSPIDGNNPGGVTPSNTNNSPANSGKDQSKSNSDPNSAKTLQVTFFTEAGHSGNCGQLDVKVGACNAVPESCNHSLSSVSHGEGFTCTGFTVSGCGGEQFSLEGDLGSFDDKAIALKCVAA